MTSKAKTSTGLHGSALCTEMQRVFGLPPARWACPTLYLLGRLVCDPALLERGIAHVNPVPDGVSLKEHIRTHYGEAAVDLVLRAIDGEKIS